MVIFYFNYIWNDSFTMHEIFNKFLLNGDNSMLALHLRQPVYTYKACGAFTRHCKKMWKSKETVQLNHIYKSELDRTCFVQDDEIKIDEYST